MTVSDQVFVCLNIWFVRAQGGKLFEPKNMQKVNDILAENAAGQKEYWVGIQRSNTDSE